MIYITEPERSVPVRLETDVAVVGGGIAGVSAAIAAARGGRRVALIEREYSLGGMATLGLIAIYLPLCDGMGNQLVGGIGEELLKLSVRYAAEGPLPEAWLGDGGAEARRSERYMAKFNPNLFALSLERLLRERGVTVLYGTAVCAVRREGRLLRELIVENKSGRSAVAAASFIDCSGDADVCARAGVPTQLYSRGNGLASWYYYSDGGAPRLKMFGLADVPAERRASGTGVEQSNVKVESLDAGYRFSGVDGYELSDAVQRAHEKMFDDILRCRASDGAYVPVTVSTVPLVRMSRRLDGEYTLDIAEDKRRFDDSIGMTGDWRRRGPAYELPFRTLFCREADNLLAAGRCISVTDAMWDVTRVIPACAVTGQAAGAAAALSPTVSGLDLRRLQTELRRGGVRLHWQDEEESA